MAYNIAAYPYPVLDELDNFNKPLRDDAACYYDGSDTENYVFQVELAVEDPDIQEYIKKGDAAYFIQVDCPSTNFRFSDRFSTGRYEVRIPRMEVLNKVTISCRVIAARDIKGYVCEGFNQQYYKGQKFDLEEGDIMVIFRDGTFDTKLKRRENATLGDYIEFRETPNKTLSIDLEDIIYISLPKKMDKQRKEVADIMDGNSAIAHATFANVALIEALGKIGQYRRTTWAKSLRIQLLGDDESFKEGVDYILDEYGEIQSIPNPVNVASKILKDPYTRMLEGMKKYQLK